MLAQDVAGRLGSCLRWRRARENASAWRVAARAGAAVDRARLAGRPGAHRLAAQPPDEDRPAGRPGSRPGVRIHAVGEFLRTPSAARPGDRAGLHRWPGRRVWLRRVRGGHRRRTGHHAGRQLAGLRAASPIAPAAGGESAHPARRPTRLGGRAAAPDAGRAADCRDGGGPRSDPAHRRILRHRRRPGARADPEHLPVLERRAHRRVVANPAARASIGWSAATCAECWCWRC